MSTLLQNYLQRDIELVATTNSINEVMEEAEEKLKRSRVELEGL